MTDLVLEVFRLNGALLSTGDALVGDLGLTEKGEAAYGAAMARQERWADSLAAGLAPRDIEAASTILREIRHRLDGEAAGASLAHPQQRQGG